MISKKTILILGGAGFIGTHLASRLQIDNRVISLDLRKPVFGEPLIADVTNKEWFDEVTKRGSVDIIFFLSSVVGVDNAAVNPKGTSSNEILGVQNAIEFAKKYGVKKIVYASSSSVYEVLETPTAYNTSKLFAEQYLRDSHIEHLIIRYFNVYGPYQKNKMVLSRFIEKAINNQTITVFGDGKQTRDFTFIDDAIEATIALAATGGANGSTIDVGRGIQTPIIEVANKVKEVTGSKSSIVSQTAPSIRQPYEVRSRVSNPLLMEKILNFKCETSLDEGVKRTVKAYRKEEKKETNRARYPPSHTVQET